MKTISTNKLKKPVGVTALIVLALLACSFLYIYAFNGTFFGWTPKSVSDEASSINLNTPSAEQISDGNASKQNTIDNSSSKTGTGSDQPPAPTPQPTGKSVVAATITSVNESDTMLEIRTVIYSIQKDGTCTLSLTKQGTNTITLTVGAQSLPSSTTCKGFDIPLSELESGTWEAMVVYENDAVRGEAKKAITIK
ncbi:MAG: hypothetical protein JWN33_6 [Candidatus Saccharibacteria bacterium]|nr:hypothetical protein [Candidatus Saccharibacteria bacterium]